MSLSVIIPVLNEEKYIGKLLDCLIAQTYRDFEVIVVDGGSSDKTAKIVGRYKKKLRFLNLIKSKKGISAQRNSGARKACHSMFLFLDADVSFGESFLGSSLAEMSKRRLDIASCGIYPDLNHWYYNVFFSSINAIMRFTQFGGIGGGGWAIFCDRKIFDSAGGFNEGLKCVNDHDFIKRAAKRGRFRLLSRNITYSTRRFEKYGTKRTMRKWGKEMLYFFLYGPEEVNRRVSMEFGEF